MVTTLIFQNVAYRRWVFSNLFQAKASYLLDNFTIVIDMMKKCVFSRLTLLFPRGRVGWTPTTGNPNISKTAYAINKSFCEFVEESLVVILQK